MGTGVGSGWRLVRPRRQRPHPASERSDGLGRGVRRDATLGVRACHGDLVDHETEAGLRRDVRDRVADLEGDLTARAAEPARIVAGRQVARGDGTRGARAAPSSQDR